MKPEKQLVKVVGTAISGAEGGRLSTQIGRGIVELKDSSLTDFIANFLADRGIVQFTLNQRGENTWAMVPAMFLNENPRLVISYVFTQFPLSEIGFYGKDLTREELVRDFKFLEKILKNAKRRAS